MDLIKTFIYFSYLLTFSFHVSFSFNLESRLPVIKRGTEGTYFGYSVAEHQAVYEINGTVEHSW